MPDGTGNACGLLLIGHGTRSERGRGEFLETVNLVAGLLPEVAVGHGYLEMAEPSIEAGLSALAQRGVRRMVVCPLLLFAAGHAKRDIPEAVARGIDRIRDSAGSGVANEITWVQAPPLGCQEELLELSSLRFREALAGRPSIAERGGHGTPAKIDAAETGFEDTALVLVGRGSLDAEACAEMRRFTELRGRRPPVGRFAACFLAMAAPTLPDTLAEIAREPWRRVVVQPHLLFHGELLDQVAREVAAARSRWPDRQWLAANHLGPHPLLAACLAQRFREGIRELSPSPRLPARPT